MLGAGFHAEYLGAVDADDVRRSSTIARAARPSSSRPTRRAGSRSATRSCATSRTRACRTGTRRRLHGQVADSILADADDGADSDAALLSLHFFHAQRYDEAWRYARVAADAARDVYANVEAAKLYVRALGRGSQSRRCSR